jgi:hypothetical protein
MFPLASDTTGAAIAFLGMIFALGVCSLICIPINHYWGRRTWWGLTIALIPTLGGAFAEFMFLTIGGGAPPFAHAIALLPLLVGIRGILIWRRPREGA